MHRELLERGYTLVKDRGTLRYVAKPAKAEHPRRELVLNIKPNLVEEGSTIPEPNRPFMMEIELTNGTHVQHRELSREAEEDIEATLPRKISLSYRKIGGRLKDHVREAEKDMEIKYGFEGLARSIALSQAVYHWLTEKKESGS
ncbi:hypothetical protein HY572_01780 [Candidatus Micrarchaeota archaeon]|nr:hypothetical protein [Candidatus Micrarchaeota archaeon]